ncbi:DUF2779 domain-containing protein [bacterium]|nr:DUF2779 domain-containing protein [bacterium]
MQSRPNRVYFDFESINSAIPPMDDVFPLTQVITQNSVIKTEVRGNNHYYEYENELNNEQKSKSSDQVIAEPNMIRDPTKLNTTWLKKVIDRLIDTKHPVDFANPNCTT